MKKIVITGPESTGKSTLSSQLAEYYGTSWCPEFAREYLKDIGRDYSYEDLLNIARGQLELEQQLMKKASNGFYFIDTDLYVMKVWCEIAFEQCHTWILKQIARSDYDLYILCDTDLPWEHDDLREYPEPAARHRLLKIYQDILVHSGVPWVKVSGTDAVRFQTAVSVINSFFPSP